MLLAVKNCLLSSFQNQLGTNERLKIFDVCHQLSFLIDSPWAPVIMVVCIGFMILLSYVVSLFRLCFYGQIEVTVFCMRYIEFPFHYSILISIGYILRSKLYCMSQASHVNACNGMTEFIFAFL